MKKLFLYYLIMANMLAGYSFIQAQVPFSFSAGSGTFTPLTSASAFTWNGSSDEGYTNSTAIGFTFNYLGTNYSDFQVSTNGFLRLGTGLATALTTNNLAGTTRQIIAPLWDDLRVDSSTFDITYKLDGTSDNQILTVEWKNVKWNYNSPLVNAEFQVQLFENNGVIKFIYGNMDTSYLARSASIGLVDNTINATNNSATGKFLSINIGGWNGITGVAVYHQTMSWPFNGIITPPPDNTVFTFTPVTPSAIAGGPYTVGGSSPTYNTLSEAAMALNINGISGAVILDVRAGTYDDIFHLINVAGTSSTNTITLQKESGAVTMLPLNGSQTTSSPGIIAGDAIIRLDGTKYTTIDGINLTNNDSASTVLKFEMGICIGTSHLNGVHTSGAQYNVVKNLTIDMNTNTGTPNNGTTGIRFGTYNSTETNTALANSYNTIQDVNIYDFWRGAVKFFGTSSANPDVGNKITAVTGRNIFGDVSLSTGTAIDVRVIEIDCEADLTIEKTDIRNITSTLFRTNSIRAITYNPAASTTNYSSGTHILRDLNIYNLQNTGGLNNAVVMGIDINVFKKNSVAKIYNNQIYNLGMTSTADTNMTGSVRGISINYGGTEGTHGPDTAYIYNNMISDLRAPNSYETPGVRGMTLLDKTSGTSAFYVYHNTVYLDNSVPPSISKPSQGHNSACLHWGNFTSASLDLKNNVFVNTMGNSYGSGGFSRAMVLYPGNAANFLRITAGSDNNLYYVDNPNKIGSANRSFHNPGSIAASSISMTELQTVTGYAPRDANSVSDVVAFVNNNNLHLTGSSLGNGNLACLPITGYSIDIDGDTRDASYPYKGADEQTTAFSSKVLNYTALVQGLFDGTNMIPDTMTVYLHNTSSPYAAVDSAKAVLNSKGMAKFIFNNAVNGTNYYIATSHRNAVETWSASGKSFNAYSMNYDFTNDSTKAYSDGVNANLPMKKINGKWCFWSGEVTNNYFVEYDDLLQVYNFYLLALEDPGYYPEDLTGNEYVEYDDVLLVYNNYSIEIWSQNPLNPVLTRPVKVKEIINNQNNQE